MRHLLTNHAGLLATRRVISISMDDIEAVLRPLLVRSQDQFQRTKCAIIQVFDFAIAHGHCETNPADWRRIKNRFHNQRKGEYVWSTDGKQPISNKAVYLYLTRTMGFKVTLPLFRCC